MNEALAQRLAAWRDSPAAADPVRRQLIEAMARRAAAHQGAALAVIEARLGALLDEALPAPAPALAPAPAAVAAAASSPGPLAALRRLLDGDEAAPVLPAGSSAAAAAPAELKTVRRYRRTWQRLSAEQRLVQSLAQVPPQAGPLNTPRLVHQALCLMRDTAPVYLHHLATQVDALLWLEQASGFAGAGRKPGKPGKRGG